MAGGDPRCWFGNPQKTMAVVSFAARPWARVLEVSGYTVVVGEGADVRVDLVARLGTGRLVRRLVGV